MKRLTILLLPLLMTALCSCDKPDPGFWIPPPYNNTEKPSTEKPEEEEPITPALPEEG